MKEVRGIYTEEERIDLRNKELKRLRKIFKNLPKEQLDTAVGLIEHAAFHRVMLDELSQIIARDGMIESYQNGENQKGIKKSAAVDSYDKAVGTYSKIIKQLTEILKDASDGSAPGAELLAFVNRR